MFQGRLQTSKYSDGESLKAYKNTITPKREGRPLRYGTIWNIPQVLWTWDYPTQQTKKSICVTHKNASRFYVTKEEMHIILVLFLINGYQSLPSGRDCWSTIEDIDTLILPRQWARTDSVPSKGICFLLITKIYQLRILSRCYVESMDIYVTFLIIVVKKVRARLIKWGHASWCQCCSQLKKCWPPSSSLIISS